MEKHKKQLDRIEMKMDRILHLLNSKDLSDLNEKQIARQTISPDAGAQIGQLAVDSGLVLENYHALEEVKELSIKNLQSGYNI